MSKTFRALFLDLSGVLYEGRQVIPGAVDTVGKARQAGLVLRFVTNTASKSADEVLAQLRAMNIPVGKDELFTAPLAAKRYIQKRKLRPYCLIHQAIKKDFSDIDQSQPDCVLLGDARNDLNYDNLNRAFQLCKQGAPLIGIGMNKYFKDDDGLKLDAGGFIRAIEWAAGIEAVIMGKPDRAFFQEIVASTPFRADQCLMVGDDVAADVGGAVAAGLQGCLVRTGKFQERDQDLLPTGAWVVDSVVDVLPTG